MSVEPSYLQQVEVQSATRRAHRRHFATSCRTVKEDSATSQRAATTRQNTDITDHMTTHHTSLSSAPTTTEQMSTSCRLPGELPAVQVWPDDAAEEVDCLVEAWRRQTAPHGHSVHGAAGDGAAGGRSLRRRDTRKEDLHSQLYTICMWQCIKTNTPCESSFYL